VPLFGGALESKAKHYIGKKQSKALHSIDLNDLKHNGIIQAVEL